MNNLLGTNQFTVKRRLIRSKTAKSVIILLFLLLVFIAIDMGLQIYVSRLQSKIKIISPLSSRSYITDQADYTEPSLNPNISEREQNKQLIVKVWGKDSWTGLNIARCESGYRTAAINHNKNGTTDEGVFQENTVHNMPGMLNAVANISYAYTQYLKQGTGPWYSSQSCWGSVIAEK